MVGAPAHLRKGSHGFARICAAFHESGEKRKHDNQVTGWVLFVGYLAVAVAVFVLWRMRLL
jgi:hypothetical protein